MRACHAIGDTSERDKLETSNVIPTRREADPSIAHRTKSRRCKGRGYVRPHLSPMLDR